MNKHGSLVMPIKLLAPGKSVVVDSRSASIGADVDCDVVLPREEGIQPRHATIKMVAARWIVESAGDWLLQADDGVPGRKQWLVSGSRIRLDRTGPEIVFSQYEAEGRCASWAPPGVTVAENERQGTCSCGVCPEEDERSEVDIAEGAIPSDTVEEVLAERHGLKSQEATAGRRPTFFAGTRHGNRRWCLPHPGPSACFLDCRPTSGHDHFCRARQCENAGGQEQKGAHSRRASCIWW